MGLVENVLRRFESPSEIYRPMVTIDPSSAELFFPYIEIMPNNFSYESATQANCIFVGNQYTNGKYTHTVHLPVDVVEDYDSYDYRYSPRTYKSGTYHGIAMNRFVSIDRSDASTKMKDKWETKVITELNNSIVVNDFCVVLLTTHEPRSSLNFLDFDKVKQSGNMMYTGKLIDKRDEIAFSLGDITYFSRPVLMTATDNVKYNFKYYDSKKHLIKLMSFKFMDGLIEIKNESQSEQKKSLIFCTRMKHNLLAYHYYTQALAAYSNKYEKDLNFCSLKNNIITAEAQALKNTTDHNQYISCILNYIDELVKIPSYVHLPEYQLKEIQKEREDFIKRLINN